jgi:hypothetical protein
MLPQWHQFGGGKRKTMKERAGQEPAKDPSLDVPSEANRGKHANFREAEDKDRAASKVPVGDTERQRRDQWERGFREGLENSENQSAS